MSTIEVLISCMHQKDHTIITKSNIQTNVIVINQCDENNREEFTFINKAGKECHALFISTTDRGLSKSRNLALKNATADICIICDDDEILYDNYENLISNNFNKNLSTQIITFQIDNTYKKYSRHATNISYLKALKIASWQIAFRLSAVKNKKIFFDETLGSGVSKAGGEENVFLYDCLRNHFFMV